jgi:hypothetical protein
MSKNKSRIENEETQEELQNEETQEELPFGYLSSIIFIIFVAFIIYISIS